MANKINNLKDVLKDLRYGVDFLQKIDCSEEDNKKYIKMKKEGLELPEGVFQYEDEQGNPYEQFYTIYETDLTPEEKTEYLLLRKMSYIKAIKSCVVFFTVLTVIGLVATVFLLLS